MTAKRVYTNYKLTQYAERMREFAMALRKGHGYVGSTMREYTFDMEPQDLEAIAETLEGMIRDTATATE